MRIHRPFLLHIAAAWIIITRVLAQNSSPPPSQLELNGFFIGQYKEVPQNVYGKPWQETKTEDGWIYRAYMLDEQSNTYIAFKYSAERADQIYSIQIAGSVAICSEPFVGIRLGDSRAQLLERFVKPSKVEHESDYPVDLITYEDSNYSIEIDKTDRISSIQIYGYAGFETKPTKYPMDVHELQQCLESRTTACLADWIGLALKSMTESRLFIGRNPYVKKSTIRIRRFDSA